MGNQTITNITAVSKFVATDDQVTFKISTLIMQFHYHAFVTLRMDDENSILVGEGVILKCNIELAGVIRGSDVIIDVM